MIVCTKIGSSLKRSILEKQVELLQKQMMQLIFSDYDENTLDKYLHSFRSSVLDTIKITQSVKKLSADVAHRFLKNLNTHYLQLINKVEDPKIDRIKNFGIIGMVRFMHMELEQNVLRISKLYNMDSVDDQLTECLRAYYLLLTEAINQHTEGRLYVEETAEY